MIKLTFSEQFKVIADKYNDKAFIISFHSKRTYSYNEFYRLVLSCNYFFKKTNLKLVIL